MSDRLDDAIAAALARVATSDAARRAARAARTLALDTPALRDAVGAIRAQCDATIDAALSRGCSFADYGAAYAAAIADREAALDALATRAS